jgi:hypothetical protein
MTHHSRHSNVWTKIESKKSNQKCSKINLKLSKNQLTRQTNKLKRYVTKSKIVAKRGTTRRNQNVDDETQRLFRHEHQIFTKIKRTIAQNQNQMFSNNKCRRTLHLHHCHGQSIRHTCRLNTINKRHQVAGQRHRHSQSGGFHHWPYASYT